MLNSRWETSFQNYLNNNNQLLGPSGYPQSWLDQQTVELREARQIALEFMTQKKRDNQPLEPTQLLTLFKTIHQRVAKQIYSIAQNARRGHLIISERVGTLRISESYGTKAIPKIDKDNEKDQQYFRLGRMPQILDRRLQLLGHNPSLMSFDKKVSAMHHQPAWMQGNDVLQITSYIEAYYGKEKSFYFLSAYYKETIVNATQPPSERERLFANALKGEAEKLGQQVGLVFSVASRELSQKEKTAYQLAYEIYPHPSLVEGQFLQCLNFIAEGMQQLNVSDKHSVTEFCFESFQRYIHLHPFLDANYRTFAVFMNAWLEVNGYESIDFHSEVIKTGLNTPFGKEGANRAQAIELLMHSLQAKTPEQVLGSSAGLFAKYRCETADKAIRNAAANGQADDLSQLLTSHPEAINQVDHNPEKGWTALHWACFKQQVACIKLLLDQDADYGIADKTTDQQTAIDLAIASGNIEMQTQFANYITQKYAKEPTIENREKAFRVAAYQGDLPALKLFIALNVHVNEPGPSTGQTALHRATQAGHISCVEFLLASGADKNIPDNKGKTAMDYAQDHSEMLALFQQSTFSHRA